MLESLLQSTIADPLAWYAVADWLEEAGHSDRAELVRLSRCSSGNQDRIAELLQAGVRPDVPTMDIDLGQGVSMRLAYIPPGSFMMGSPVDEPDRSDDETQHQVTLTNGFYLGIHQVTQSQWQWIMGDNPSHFNGGDLPVETISWNDCQKFIDKLNGQTGNAFRLPEEAEWEYACRAGTTTPFHFGKAMTPDQSNYYGVRKREYRRQTTPVGSFPFNAWGLCDMHGNVWEWCQSPYLAYNGHGFAMQSPDISDLRVLRGGSWCSSPWRCRSATRNAGMPYTSTDYNFCGCRILLEE